MAFVSHVRLGELANHPGYLPLAPDLIVEVVAPSDRSSDVEGKALAWLVAGVSAVLAVAPRTRMIRHYRSTHEVRIHNAGTIDLSDVVAGYELDVSELFA